MKSWWKPFLQRKEVVRSRQDKYTETAHLKFVFTILAGHLVGFPLGYTYLHTVCLSGCSLTPGNVHALEHLGLSIAFYANLYLVIQVLYILVCVGVALLIVYKKPGQWVPLGMSAFLVGLSAYPTNCATSRISEVQRA